MRLFAVLALAVCFLLPVTADGEPAPYSREGGPRVRPKDQRVASLLLEGMRGSPTVRQLVERIEAGNVIVYIEHQPALSARLQGSLQFLVATGGYRYVRVAISPKLSGSASVSALAHELQHVVEIVDTPSVSSQASLVALYRRIGHETPSVEMGFDTAAARDVGFTVRRELLAGSKSPLPDVPSVEQLLSWQRHSPLRPRMR